MTQTATIKQVHAQYEGKECREIQVRNMTGRRGHIAFFALSQENNSSMSAIVLTAVERELKRREWQERWAQLPTTDLGVDAATLIAEARAERDAELFGAKPQ